MQLRILDTTPVPEGLQQQAATGAGPETESFGQREAGASTSAVPVMAPLSVRANKRARCSKRGGRHSQRTGGV